MGHSVDGFDLSFTSRTSWKAHRRAFGKLIDNVPVTWTKGRRQESPSSEIFLEVWYQDNAEMEARRADPTPFIVALAIAKDYSQFPHEFHEFRGIFEVAATGVKLSDQSIETKILRRIRAGEE
jgi:hypothetical protein